MRGERVKIGGSEAQRASNINYFLKVLSPYKDNYRSGGTSCDRAVCHVTGKTNSIICFGPDIPKTVAIDGTLSYATAMLQIPVTYGNT